MSNHTKPINPLTSLNDDKSYFSFKIFKNLIMNENSKQNDFYNYKINIYQNEYSIDYVIQLEDNNQIKNNLNENHIQYFIDEDDDGDKSIIINKKFNLNLISKEDLLNDNITKSSDYEDIKKALLDDLTKTKLNIELEFELNYSYGTNYTSYNTYYEIIKSLQ